jgi:uncharacterized repeat protein (TIGR01451 family)
MFGKKFIVSVIIILLIVISLAMPVSVLHNKVRNVAAVSTDQISWVAPNCKYRLKVKVKFSEYVLWKDNTPVKIVLNKNSDNKLSEFFNNVKSDASNIYVTDLSGNKLDYWIEQWEPDTGYAIIWVSFKTANSYNSDFQIIYIYYGNPNPDVSGNEWHKKPPDDPGSYPGNSTEGWYAGNGNQTFDFFDDFNEKDEFGFEPENLKKKWNIDRHGYNYNGVWAGEKGNGVCEIWAHAHGGAITIWPKSNPVVSADNYVWEMRLKLVELYRDVLHSTRALQRVRPFVSEDVDTDGDGEIDEKKDQYGFAANITTSMEYFWANDYTGEYVVLSHWYKNVEIVNRMKKSFDWIVYYNSDDGDYQTFERTANILDNYGTGNIKIHAGGTSYPTNYGGYAYIDYVFCRKKLPYHTDEFTPEKRIDFSVGVSSDPDSSGYVSKPLTFYVKLDNLSSEDSHSVTVKCSIPSNYGIDMSATSATSGSLNYDSSSRTLYWTLSSVSKNGSETLTIKGTPTDDGDLTLTASADEMADYDPNVFNNKGSKTVSITSLCDLNVVLKCDENPVAGSSVSYRILIYNPGPGKAYDVTLNNQRPSELKNTVYILSTDPSHPIAWTPLLYIGTVQKSTDPNTPALTVEIRGDLDSDTECGTILHYTATVTSSTKRTDFTENKFDLSCNSTVKTESDLSVSSISSSDNPVTAGRKITYDIKMKNNGPSDAKRFTITDNLPNCITDARFELAINGFWEYSGNWNGSYEIPQNISAGADLELKITGTVKSSTPNGTVLTNTASVKSTDPNNTDPHPENNSETAVTNVITRADLTIVSMSASPSPAVAGDYITYRIEVLNKGPSDARNVTVKDVLPSEITDAVYLIDSGSWKEWTGSVSLGTLSGDPLMRRTYVIYIKGKVKSDTADGTILKNNVSVSSDDTDPDTSNNSAEISTNVIRVSDLSVSQTVNDERPVYGENVTFVITVENNGPSYAANTNVNYVIPHGLSFVSYSASSGTYDKDSGIWSVGTMPDGASQTLRIVAKLTDSGKITLTAKISSDSQDNNSSNNMSSISINDNLGKPFDPPSGTKVGTTGEYGKNWPVVLWKHVWINPNPIIVKVRIVDPIPSNAEYIPNTLSYEARGSSVTFDCYYDQSSNSIIWEGIMGQDQGHTSEETANNEVVIQFKTKVVSGYEAHNQAKAYWDENDDGEIDGNDSNVANDTPALSNDPQTSQGDDPTVVYAPPRLKISVLSVPTSVPVHTRYRYVISVTNSSGRTEERISGPAFNVKLKNILPPGIKYVSSSPFAQYDPMTNTLMWNVGTIPHNGTKVFNIYAYVPDTYPAPSYAINTSVLSGSNFEPIGTTVNTYIPKQREGKGKQPPISAINITINPPEKICIGAKSKFVFTFTGGAPPYEYTVNFGDGTKDIKGKETGKFITLLHTYENEGTYVVSIDVKDTKGTESKLTRTVKAINCETVLNVYHQNFIIGYPDGTFKPDKNVSRAEVATMICRALGFEANTYNHLSNFKDLKPDEWYFGFVKKAIFEKLMNGRSKDMFCPEEPATRAEIAAILVKIRGLKPEIPDEELFTDVKKGDWFEGYVYTAVKAGLIQGYKDHTFKPDNTVTRAEFVTLMDRALYREDIPQANNINNLPSSPFKDITPSYWAYRYIIEASVPHIVTNALRAPINLSLPSKTIPVYLASLKSEIIFPNLNATVNAIVPVDGISNGKDPKERKVEVRIINKGRP